MKTENAKIWLLGKLRSGIQSVKILEIEGAANGHTRADLDAARELIAGVRVVPCLGVDYWQLTK